MTDDAAFVMRNSKVVPERSAKRQAVGDQPADRCPRAAFARGEPFQDRVLTGLFRLLETVQDQDVRVEISLAARSRLRTVFPAHNDQPSDVALANGLSITVDTGCSFGAEFYVGHLSEWRFLDAITANLPTGAQVVDVGANFGLYALHCAHAGGPEARVVGLEPLPSAAEVFERNILQNRLAGQVTALRCAAGPQDTTAVFYVASDGAFSGLHDTRRSPLRETFEVKVVALDTCPEVTGLGAVDFLKIDVEGHEGGVLAGAHNLINRSPELLIALEYSHKNLTDTGRAEILLEIGACLEKGLQVYTALDLGTVQKILRPENIPTRFAGTVLIAAPGCRWLKPVLASLTKTADLANVGPPVEAIEFLVERSKAARETADMQQRFASRLGLDVPAIPVGQAIETFVDQLKASHDTLERNYAALVKRQSADQESGKSLKSALAAKDKELANARTAHKNLQVQIEAYAKQAIQLHQKADERGEALKTAGAQRALVESELRASLEKLQAERDAAIDQRKAISLQLDAFRAHVDKQEVKLSRREEALRQAQEQQASLRSAFMEQVSSLQSALAGATEQLLSQAELISRLELELTSRQEEMVRRDELTQSIGAKLASTEMSLAQRSSELEDMRMEFRKLQQREALRALGKWRGK